MFWIKLKETLSTVWAAIKKLPGWAITGFLMLFALCWYLIDLLSTAKQVTEIRKNQVTLEKEHHETIKQIGEENEEQQEIIEKEYREKTKELEAKREELAEKASKGPVEIANAWKEYLAGGSK